MIEVPRTGLLESEDIDIQTRLNERYKRAMYYATRIDDEKPNGGVLRVWNDSLSWNLAKLKEEFQDTYNIAPHDGYKRVGIDVSERHILRVLAPYTVETSNTEASSSMISKYVELIYLGVDYIELDNKIGNSVEKFFDIFVYGWELSRAVGSKTTPSQILVPVQGSLVDI